MTSNNTNNGLFVWYENLSKDEKAAIAFYTEIPDLDAAMNRARKYGATVLNGPMDGPGGRMAQMMDPQGGAFALHQAAKN